MSDLRALSAAEAERLITAGELETAERFEAYAARPDKLNAFRWRGADAGGSRGVPLAV
ncbi:MAG: hypothetical protein NVSMB51_02360 [Solirubrobacteraceae bacterium]